MYHFVTSFLFVSSCYKYTPQIACHWDGCAENVTRCEKSSPSGTRFSDSGPVPLNQSAVTPKPIQTPVTDLSLCAICSHHPGSRPLVCFVFGSHLVSPLPVFGFPVVLNPATWRPTSSCPRTGVQFSVVSMPYSVRLQPCKRHPQCPWSPRGFSAASLSPSHWHTPCPVCCSRVCDAHALSHPLSGPSPSASACMLRAHRASARPMGLALQSTPSLPHPSPQPHRQRPSVHPVPKIKASHPLCSVARPSSSHLSPPRRCFGENASSTMFKK